MVRSDTGGHWELGDQGQIEPTPRPWQMWEYGQVSCNFPSHSVICYMRILCEVKQNNKCVTCDVTAWLDKLVLGHR